MKLTAFVTFAALVAGAACGPGALTSPTLQPSADLTPVRASAEWPSAEPEAEGLDRRRLGELAQRIRRGDYGRIASLLVARHGRLVVEEYFNGGPDGTHTMQSVTKSVVSLVTGLAIATGRLSTTDPVTRFFPGYAPIANSDARKSAMTVRDLLTMRTGLDWSENAYTGSPLQRLNDCRCDWIRFILDWPMREQPGSRWEYVSGGTILLGAIVGAATGSRLDQFANAQLFGPIGARNVSWYEGLPDGLPHGGGGLFLRSRDMAKLGQLVLDEGRWQGRTIIDPAWIAESTARSARNLRTWGFHPFDYGYLWWLTSDGGADIITASGALGQWIFVSPRHQLVVATTADNSGGNEAAAVDFFFSHILPAAR